MKPKIQSGLRKIWRHVFLPVILLLPRYRQLQLKTLAHYAKLTLLHGQVIDFDLINQNKNGEMISPRSGSQGVVPGWAISELRELSEIESQLYPTTEFIEKFSYWALPTECHAGDVYANCIAKIQKYAPDIIILVPWIVPGGADRGILHHVAAALNLGKKVLVISTLNVVSPWASQIPEEAKFLELGRLGSHLRDDQRLAVLTRIVLQSPAQVIHIINSQLGWEMIRDRGKSLNVLEKKLYASVFCDDFDDHGVRRSYPQMYLIDCWKYLRVLICDTHWFPKDLQRQYGVYLDKINTVYFPVRTTVLPIYKAKSVKRILWAGRFARQKRLDLLMAIAELLPDIKFDVHGYATNDQEREMERQLRRLGNVNVHGAFDSLEALVGAGEYSLFLYTSAWDGLPLILLDATMAGLPIVASGVGGVPEFVGEETGYLVTEVDNPSAYAARIAEAMGDTAVKRQKWDAAVELILSRHTTEHFSEQLRGVSGYFDGE